MPRIKSENFATLVNPPTGVTAGAAHGIAAHTDRTRIVDIPLGSFVVHVGTPAFAKVASRICAWAFDAAAQEYIAGNFAVPSDYVSNGAFILSYVMASATSGEVRWNIVVRTVAEGGNYDTAVGAVGNTIDDTVQGAAVNLGVFSTTIAITYVAGQIVGIEVGRIGDHANDTATGDAQLVGLAFSYTSDE